MRGRGRHKMANPRIYVPPEQREESALKPRIYVPPEEGDGIVKPLASDEVEKAEQRGDIAPAGHPETYKYPYKRVGGWIVPNVHYLGNPNRLGPNPSSSFQVPLTVPLWSQTDDDEESSSLEESDDGGRPDSAVLARMFRQLRDITAGLEDVRRRLDAIASSLHLPPSEGARVEEPVEPGSVEDIARQRPAARRKL